MGKKLVFALIIYQNNYIEIVMKWQLRKIQLKMVKQHKK